MLAFERAFGRCQKCGWPAGRVQLTERVARIAGAHVHHIQHLARGGNHAVTNLILLCAECHAAEHPHNEKLARLPRPQ